MDMLWPGSAGPPSKPGGTSGGQPDPNRPALLPGSGQRPVFTREQMAEFLQRRWDSEPLLPRIARAQGMSGPAQHSELVAILAEFQTRTGISVQVVPEGTVQRARGEGNLASLRSAPGNLQIEQQVFQDTKTLMAEVRHELAFYYAGGAGGTPRLGESMFNGLILLEMMIEGGGRLPPPVAPTGR